MEEEWFLVKTIYESDIVEKEKIDNYTKEWKELIEQFKIEYKIVLEEKKIYEDQGRNRGIELTLKYQLNLYSTKMDTPELKRIIKEYETAPFVKSQELENEVVDIMEDEKILERENKKKHIEIGILVFLIIFEICLSLESILDINIEVISILLLFLILEIYLLIRILKKREEDKNE